MERRAREAVLRSDRRRRQAAGVALVALAGAGGALLTPWPPVTYSRSAAVLLATAAAVAAVVASDGSRQLKQNLVVASLDASRRWVTLHGVHPDFVDAALSMAGQPPHEPPPAGVDRPPTPGPTPPST